MAAALQPLTRARASDATQDPDTTSVHPAQMLGMLLDMGACMDLDSRLMELEQEQEKRGGRPAARASEAAPSSAPSSAGDESEEPAGDIAELTGTLRENLSVQLDTLETTLERFLGQLSRRTGPMSDAGELFELLAHHGVPATRRAPAVRAAARAAGSAYHAALMGAAERSRSAFVSVRRDLRAKLAALGDAATRIERLDALLTWGTHQQRGELFERLSAPMDEHFRDGLMEALEALPESPSAEDFRPWYGATGWVERHRIQCEELVRSVFLHERRAILGLVEAAIEAANAAPPETATAQCPAAPVENEHEEPSNA